MTSQLAFLPLVAARKAIEVGELCPVYYIDALLSRIAAIDPQLNAFIATDGERALRRARQLRDGRASARAGATSPLFGIPYAVKDIIDVSGLPTTAHSRLLQRQLAAHDAAVVAKLNAAGAICLGKNALYEFAIGGPSFDLPWPPARNPWNRDYVAGSSSSGSGAAVAAGLVPFAIGTDTGGSIRSPASMNGIAGLKPTHGLVDIRGVFPLAPSLDTVGPLARSAADMVPVLDAILPTRRQARSAESPGVTGLRIGSLRQFFEQDLDSSPDVIRVFEDAAAKLADAGAQIAEVQVSPLQRYNAAGWVTLLSEAFAIHERWLQTVPELYGASARETLVGGAFISTAEYMRAQRIRTLLAAEIDRVLKHSDVIMTAVTGCPPCRLDDERALAVLNAASVRMPFNATGHPAIAIPAGFSSQGLPIGVQLVARTGRDRVLLKHAAAIEAVISPVERPQLRCECNDKGQSPTP